MKVRYSKPNESSPMSRIGQQHEVYMYKVSIFL